jgi:hypothetical protein
MAATERGKRRIVLNSKYRPIGTIIQHTEAVSAVSKFVRGGLDVSWLLERADEIRNRMADDDFDRDLFDHNADYIARFAEVVAILNLPKNAEVIVPGPRETVDVQGVAVTVGLHFRLRRVTKTNKVEEGAGMFRYAKGKTLAPEAGSYQAAFLLGHLKDQSMDQNIFPNRGLCLTVDAQAGYCHTAPGNSVTRYHNMRAACESIAERWPNVKPPDGAIF